MTDLQQAYARIQYLENRLAQYEPLTINDPCLKDRVALTQYILKAYPNTVTGLKIRIIKDLRDYAEQYWGGKNKLGLRGAKELVETIWVAGDFYDKP